MKRTTLLTSMMVIMALAGSSAFSQTVLTDVWKDKDQRGPAKKVAVF